MSEDKQVTFVAVGPLAGKSYSKGDGYVFENGKCTVIVGPMNYESVMRKMAANHQAFLQGSQELADKQRWFEEVALGGKRNIDTGENRNPAKQVQSPVQSDGGGAATAAPTVQPVPAPAETGSAGASPVGDRPQHPWLPKEPAQPLSNS